ncbi:MAG: hypothetical protein U0797_18580 [Gemmataceae bacterium]
MSGISGIIGGWPGRTVGRFICGTPTSTDCLSVPTQPARASTTKVACFLSSASRQPSASILARSELAR